MSTDLVQIGQGNTSLAPALNAQATSIFRRSSLFRLKPMKVQLIQGTSRKEGVTPGKFHIEQTGEHVDSLRVVMLVEPRPGKTKYTKGSEYGSSPECYSMDGIVPSPNVEHPQALSCRSCRHNDWNLWKKNGRKNEFLPPCKDRHTMYLVDREAQIPYELDVRGTSIKPFKAQMQHIAALAELYRAQKKAYPELFYFSFLITIKREIKPDGVVFVMQFSDTKLMAEDDRAEFGALVEEFEKLKRQQAADAKDDEEGAALDNEFSEGGATLEAEQPGDTSFAPGDYVKGEVNI
jgi:hypothetical protein